MTAEVEAEQPYEPEPDPEPTAASGYRTYEVYQRERVGETTNLIKPIELLSAGYADNPYPQVEILREHYPCYRDWAGNRFWITRYDDVTSVFTDDANYETRSKQWSYGGADLGRDLGAELPVLWAIERRTTDALSEVVDKVLGDVGLADSPDLASGFAARIPLELWGRVLDLPDADLGWFATRYWRMQRGATWHASSQRDGRVAFEELVRYFEPLMAARRSAPGDDLVSVVAGMELPEGVATADDLVATILETDHETLHGALSNMWFQLLMNPGQLEVLRADSRMIKFAYLETLRHSPPVISADRFARHEVERFGRLLPKGSLLHCSAAAANRDPRQFAHPDTFVVERKDLCQREPRGQYRADGLPAGIAFGLGPPSKHPAVPKERPRSTYALIRDVAVHASAALLEAWPNVSLAANSEPLLRSLRVGEMHTCWNLQISVGPER